MLGMYKVCQCVKELCGLPESQSKIDYIVTAGIL